MTGFGKIDGMLTTALLSEEEANAAVRTTQDQIDYVVETRTSISHAMLYWVSVALSAEKLEGRVKIKDGMSVPEQLNCILRAFDEVSDPLKHEVMRLHSMTAYAMCGNNTFVVGKHLEEMFLNTSLKGMKWGDVKWPFDAFRVELTDSPLRLWGGDTGWHVLRWIYITKMKCTIQNAYGTSVIKHEYVIFLQGIPNEKSKNVLDDATFRLALTPPPDEECIEDTVTGLFKKGIVRNDTGGAAADDYEERCGELSQNAVRVLMNLVQYLSCDEKETTTKSDRVRRRQRERLLDKLRETKNPHTEVILRKQIGDIGVVDVRTTVGESIEKQPRELPSGVRLHWVRGHWHMYWHGKKDGTVERSLRKHWIQPFQRGTGAKVESRDYVIPEQTPEA